MAQLVKPAPVFTHPEWTISGQSIYANAEGERASAERLVDESERVIDDTTDVTKKTQQDVNKKLEQRLTDIKHWETVLDDKLKVMKDETDALIAFNIRLGKAIEGCKEPLYIAQQCLHNRQKRRAIDLVHDDPQKELLKEVETIQGVLALLTRSKEQATEQVRLNRKAIYNLEQDLKNKSTALAIDGHNAELRNNSEEIAFHRAAAKIDANSTTPEQWVDFSNQNIIAAEKQRQNSTSLRSILDGIVQSVSNDMNAQKDAVDLAMTKRIVETRDSKAKLEDHLSKVLQQIQQMEDNAENLRKAIADKTAPLQLAQTRLDNRSIRPHVELCRDPVQYRLVDEVGQIEISVAQLEQRLAQTEVSLRGLVRQQLDLEEDIAVKANTLFIDETECMGMRKSISIHAY